MLKRLSKLRVRATRQVGACLVFCLAITLSACQSSKVVAPVQLQEQLLIPEPLIVPYRTEIAIARITDLLVSESLSPEQQARLFYDRGVMYDSVGLPTLARLDFMRALRLKPDIASVHNIVGIHQTLAGDFAQAYESFDSTLELDPSYEFAYLNRAIALQYDEKLELAVADFLRFQQLKPSDPYRVLWLYLAERQLDAAAAQRRLETSFSDLNQQLWSSQIVAFYLGKISEQALLQIAIKDVQTPQQLAEQLCEVYFYLAKWHANHGNPTLALEYYKKTLATNVYEFVEYRYARVEMQLLRQQYGTHMDDGAGSDEHAH